MTRAEVCENQLICLHCPLAKFRTGKRCEELTEEQIRRIMLKEMTNYVYWKKLVYRTRNNKPCKKA